MKKIPCWYVWFGYSCPLESRAVGNGLNLFELEHERNALKQSCFLQNQKYEKDVNAANICLVDLF